MPEKMLPHDHGQSMERELGHMPSVDNFQTVADIFKQLGDGSRIRIFWLLCHCEECVVNLSSMVEMSSPAVSHHLRQLKAGGLIVSRREGKEVYYKAAGTERAQTLHRMIEAMVEIACPAEEGARPGQASRQTEAVRAVHGLLTGQLDRRFTIEELSRRFLINTAALKEGFKAVYGLPIAAYMKEYRIRRAMELLRETSQSVADVAAQVGYETQGKLSKAFKEATGQTPTEYRRQHRGRKEE